MARSLPFGIEIIGTKKVAHLAMEEDYRVRFQTMCGKTIFDGDEYIEVVNQPACRSCLNALSRMEVALEREGL